MVIQADSNRLIELVGTEPQIEKVASGFRFTEGPIWNPVKQCLYFSDIPSDERWCWSEANGQSVVRSVSGIPANKCNGMTYDRELNLYICEHSTSQLVRENVSGQREVVASHWEGKELNSPNDVVVSHDGSVYFTDPTYGRIKVFGKERETELNFRGVFRVSNSGILTCVADDFIQPNGLCFSPDESLLYINDTAKAHIRVFDVSDTGELSNNRLFAEGIGDSKLSGGVVDGMKCDVEGNIYVTGPSGFWVFGSDGERLGVIEMPEHSANLNWGGVNWNDLYCCCSTSVYRVSMRVSGNKLGYMK